MKVKSLHLQNYGRFEDLKIDFAPTAEKSGNVTVIVGNNGAGKSQILQGLATSLSWFVGSLKTGENFGLEIEVHSIKNNKNEASIKITTNLERYNNLNDSDPKLSNVQWQLAKVKDGRVQQLDSNFSQLNDLVKKYRNKLTHVENFSLPLLVFYPVERAILQYVEAEVLPDGYEQMKGYSASLDGASIEFKDFLDWFRNAEDIENEMLRYTSRDLESELNYRLFQESENEKLLQRYDDLAKLVKKYKELSVEDLEGNLELLNSKIKKLQEYAEATEPLFRTALNINDVAKKKQLLFNKLHVVKEAVEYFTGFKNPRIRRQGTPTMIVEKDGEELDVNQLSQGEKSLLALVGDIARRLALLNPSLENPLEGEGVVMIDEVDLHLHPKWQHDLIDKLVKTFPNVQFILTTHSPHVISDRADILVYSLDDGELTQVPNIYGEDVNTVLSKVFDVPIRDPKAQADFDEVARLIYEKKFKEAENQIVELEKQMPENLELLRCRLHLTQAQLAEKQEG